MSFSRTEDYRQRLSCELSIRDLEDGKMLEGDCGAAFSPPDDFDMAKFHRGRQFYRDHLFICSAFMLFSLVIGVSVPEFLKALVFTSQSDTPVKARKRYTKTFYHVALWHYGNIWEKDSEAHKSICQVRQIHRIVRENMQKGDTGRRTRKFLSQYDMGVVLSGFMSAIVMYPEVGGIRCSLDDLDNYVYFWYGVGHVLGIQKKYNICAHGLSQAQTFCKSIEQDIVKKNLENPSPEFKQITEAIVQSFQGSLAPGNLLTFPVISALSHEVMVGDKGTLGFADTIKYWILRFVVFTAKHVPWFKLYLNHRIERIYGIPVAEM